MRPVLLLVVLLVKTQLVAAPSMHTMLTNGPVANRVNVVLLAEGYTSAQQGQFLADATNALNTFFSYQPYREYRSYFNAFAIAVVSNESGSDHPAAGVFRDTYFNSRYDSTERLITIPTNSSGFGKVETLLAQFMPDVDLPVLLVNDPVSGGSGGPLLIASSASATTPEILVHESGHTLGGLADEYDIDTFGSGPLLLDFPNVTTNTEPDLIPWKAWIEPDTPLPTPPTFNNWDKIGLFEGANYTPVGWYRAKYDCLMRNTWSWLTFCEVCQEALVLAIYERVRPVESFSPANTNLLTSSVHPITFTVATLQPATGSVQIQWSTNGTAAPGETNLSFTLTPSSLGNGRHRVQASIQDNSAIVRSDPFGRLRQILGWTLQVDLVELHLEEPAVASGGAVQFRVMGHAVGPVVIEGSTNLRDWTPLSTNALSPDGWLYTHESSAAAPFRFFRAVTPAE